MSTYKYYLLGIIILFVGVAIGWISKPNVHTEMQENFDHTGSKIEHSHDDIEAIWTCSMHPQIRQNELGICPICEMDLIPLDNSLSNDDPTVLQMTETAAKLAQVETTTVGEVSMAYSTSSIKVDGTVELDESSINSQSSHLGGRIESIHVNFEGEYVKAGQKIATIYSTDLLAATQELITAAKFEDKVPGIKDASIQKLKNWKISDRQIQNIFTSGKPIETIDIYADHSGYVLNKKVSLGDYIKTGQTLYTIGKTDRLWLIMNVYESDLGKVRIGQKVTFTTPSLGETKFTANISYIEPLLNPMTRTGVIRAEIANTRKKLKPGMLLKGHIRAISSTAISTSVVVPKSAVLWTGERSVVYVQLPDTEVPSYQYREVTIGDQSGNMISILEGIENGETIVTHGAFAIDAAAQLNNNMSMMNKNVSIKKDEHDDVVPNYTEETPEDFKDQLDALVQEYISLKDALVLTDPNAATIATNELLDQTKKIDMQLLQGEAHMYWMEQLGVITAHAIKITESVDVEEQRNQFDFLSQGMISSLKAFGTRENTYYVLYCPMAKGNQGADWISAEEQIRNPYFGDKMMKCGSVKLAL
ncbi:MAG: efflux RND transporter periplasmic adaptor subunit [Saprospiraceae bacterium]